jgi:DNA topoisomerase II
MSYDAFINHELILFSMADNQRSIPSIMDGLKPSQRKVSPLVLHIHAP